MVELSEEQRKALVEKLKSMSPEELREFQKKQCIFCQIVANKMEGKKVYEDDKAIGILDINPASVGHVLLMPKEHYAIMPQIPEDEIKHLGIVSKHLSKAVLQALKVEGTTIFIANGLAAGQRAQHFMMHIIPRMQNDGVGLFIPQRQMREDDVARLRESIENKANELFGIKKEVVVERRKKKAEEEEKIPEIKVADFKELEKQIGAEPVKVFEEVKEKTETKKKTKGRTKEKKETKKEGKKAASLDEIAELFK